MQSLEYRLIRTWYLRIWLISLDKLSLCDVFVFDQAGPCQVYNVRSVHKTKRMMSSVTCGTTL